MRELTDAQHGLLAARRAAADAMAQERPLVLRDFAERIGMSNPDEFLAMPVAHVSLVHDFIAPQQVASEDRSWVLTRLAYFIGEVLAARFGGSWFLDELPDTRFFGRVVVGRFSSPVNPAAQVDPFEVAASFVDEPPGRSLRTTLDGLFAELQAA